MKNINVIKLLKWFLILFFGLIIALYLFLIVGLKLTASGVGFPKSDQEAVYSQSMVPHAFKLIDSGSLSLFERLQLIENAQKSIELEFFIFDIDTTSRLITQALIKKSKEGVKVRLLVDFSAPVFQLRPAYAQLMEQSGILVRYYNTSSLYRFFQVQHRSHRKLLIIDSEKFLTGGRNIADDYFDLSEHYNFLDSDVLIQGPISKTALASFNLYWNSNYTTEPKNLYDQISPQELVLAKAFFDLKKEDAVVLEKINKIGSTHSHLLPQAECNNTTFVTDFPGAGEAHRKIYSTIVNLVSETKNEIYIESPYFVLRQEGYDVFKRLIDRNIKVNVLTNGLYSTDAYYIISTLWYNLNWIAQIGLNLNIYNGDALNTDTIEHLNQNARWGIHAKRAVLDEHTVLIGTYNIDPRSANLNSELMIVCKDNVDFAKMVKHSMENRILQSTLILSDKKIINNNALFDRATTKQKVMTLLATPLAMFFDIIL